MLAEVKPAFLRLPDRSSKPRAMGLTHVIDKGAPVSVVEDVIEQSSGFIDIWKFGWGTSYVDTHVKTKIDLLKSAKIKVCTGGTLLEISWCQDRVNAMLEFARETGFDCIEVSNGVAAMPLREKRELISRSRDLGFEVLAEVGSKDPNTYVDEQDWVDEIEGDLLAGASWSVTEGRENGNVGMYEADGSARCSIVNALNRSGFVDKIIFEAPKRAQQAFLIRKFGANVSLGNILLEDIIGLETLRLGLRADTMDCASFGFGR